MMKRILLFVAYIAMTVAPVRGQDLPEAPKPHRAAFWAGVSLLAASQTTDAITTRRLLNHGYSEMNPLFGLHPSVGRQVAINIVMFAGGAAAFYLSEKSHNRFVRWSGRAMMAFEIADHADLAACNMDLTRRCHYY